MNTPGSRISLEKNAVLSIAFGLIFLYGCSSSPESSDENTENTAKAASQVEENVPAKNPDGQTILKGIIVSVSANAFQVKKMDTDSMISVKVIPPFHLYSRESGSLTNVKDSAYIGVTTTRQADGTDLASEIHIFPNELRGLGEGSNMMNKGATPSTGRMTNGKVSASRMTNGNASVSNESTAGSRMSNGNVKRTNASTLEVQFQGHTRTITVPDSLPVTEFKPSPATLAAGDRVDFLVRKTADGSFTSGKGILQKK